MTTYTSYGAVDIPTVRMSGLPGYIGEASHWCYENLGIDGYISSGFKWRRDFVRRDLDIIIYDFMFANESDAVMFKLKFA